MTTLNKKSKEIKTIKKTQVEETTISNTTRKEDKAMKQQEVLKENLTRFLQLYNNDQAALKKNSKYRYTLITKEQALEYFKTLDPKTQREIAHATYIVNMYQVKMKNYVKNERKLNKAYGQETVHPSELPKKEESNMERQSKQMIQTQKAYEDRLKAIINKAIKEAVKEELDKKGGE